MLKLARSISGFSTYRFPAIQRLKDDADLSKLKKITLVHPDKIS